VFTARYGMISYIKQITFGLQKDNIQRYFQTHVSVHHDSMLIKRSNLTQQYADIYLLQSHFTCFGTSQHPSSGALKTVTATSGICHNTGTATSFQRGLLRTPVTPETCRVTLR